MQVFVTFSISTPKSISHLVQFKVVLIIRRFGNKCDMVEEPTSPSKNDIRVQFFSLLTGKLV